LYQVLPPVLPVHKVFGGNHFGMCPTINLHGVEFRAVLPPPVAAPGSVILAGAGEEQR
jgi:hypothetical protein